MTRTVLADRLDLLEEIESIGAALDVLEQRHDVTDPTWFVETFTHAALADVRQRQQRARGVVLEQLGALLDAVNTATVH